MLQYLFESCLASWGPNGPERFLIILIRDFAVIASREFQLYLSLSYLFTYLELSYVIRGFFQNLSSVNQNVSDDFHVRQGSLGYKFDEIVLANTPSQVNKNVQKRSVISMTPLGLQDTISWMFVNTSSNKSTFKVFYYKILKPN